MASTASPQELNDVWWKGLATLAEAQREAAQRELYAKVGITPPPSRDATPAAAIDRVLGHRSRSV